MTAVQRLISNARRRALLNRALVMIGRGTALGAVIGLVAILIERRLGLNISPNEARLIWLPCALGLLAGAMLAWRARPDRLAVAVRIDQHLGLKDRLGTAQTINDGVTHDPFFAQLVRADADRVARGIHGSHVTPIRVTGVWIAAVVMIAALFAAQQWLPFAQPARSTIAGSGTPQDQPAELTRTQQQVAQAIEQTARDLHDAPLDDRAREQLAALDRLAEQMNNPTEPPPSVRQARDEAAARLDSLADELDSGSARDLAAADAVAQQFSKLTPPPGPLSKQQFTDALRRGDFGRAADLLEQMLGKTTAPDATNRPELAGDLRWLSEQLRQTAKESDTPQAAQQPDDPLRQALADQGIDEQTANNLLKDSDPDQSPPTPAQAEQALRDKGIDLEIARKLAREIQQRHEQEQTQDQAQRSAQELADEMARAAEALEHPRTPENETPKDEPPGTPPSGGTGEDHPQPPSGSSQPSPSGQSPDQQKAPTAGTSDPSRKPEPSQQDRPSPQGQRSPSPQPGSSDPSKPQPTQQQQQGQQQQGQQPGEQPKAEPSAQPSSTPRPDGKQPGTQPGSQPEGRDPKQPSDQPGQSTDQPQSKPQSKDSQSPPDSSPQTTPSPGSKAVPTPGTPGTPDQQATQDQSQSSDEPHPQPAPGGKDPTARSHGPGSSLVDHLRELADRHGNAQRQQALSEQVRQRARELADQLTDEERQQLARWAQQQADHPPAGGRDAGSDHSPLRNSPDNQPPSSRQTEVVDSRGENDPQHPGEQVIAQWLGDETAQGQPAQSTAVQEHVAQARQAAERAVNDEAVPARYHELIKRYFGRLGQTVDRAAGSPTPDPKPGDNPGSNP